MAGLERQRWMQVPWLATTLASLAVASLAAAQEKAPAPDATTAPVTAPPPAENTNATTPAATAPEPATPPPPENTRVYNSTVHARPLRDDDAQAIVMTGRVLQERGAQNLGDVLALVPEMAVRQGGMGMRVDLRGAKQRSILVLIDGVPMDEPYFGAFDVTAIPITDIVEVRIQLAPASPLEGPGGDGGIIEVFTLHATGAKRLEGRAVGSSQPSGEGALTGRIPLFRDESFGLRLSAGGRFADPGYPVISDAKQAATFFDRTAQGYASARLEGVTKSGVHLTGDLWYGHRSFYIPPSDLAGAQLQNITGENAARVVFGAELPYTRFRLAFGAYGEIIQRTTDFYDDYTQAKLDAHQNLFTARVGSAAYGDRFFVWRDTRLTLSTRLSVDGEGAQITQTNTTTGTGVSEYGELAIGAKLRWRQIRIDAAVGALLPFGNPAGAWPEAKLSLTYQPARVLSITLVGARKGRLPTIRELYDPLQGNDKLHPEQTWHGEAILQLRPNEFVSARLSGYVREIDGFIRAASGCGQPTCHNVNLDTIDVRGLETGFDIFRDRIVGGGFMYLFQDAYSKTLGFTAIPNMPNHRVDMYVASTWKRRLGAMLRFRYISERYLQGVYLPRYGVFDFYTWAKINRNFRASVHVDNLTNTNYLELPGLQALGTTVTATIDGVWE